MCEFFVYAMILGHYRESTPTIIFLQELYIRRLEILWGLGVFSWMARFYSYDHQNTRGLVSVVLSLVNGKNVLAIESGF